MLRVSWAETSVSRVYGACIENWIIQWSSLLVQLDLNNNVPGILQIRYMVMYVTKLWHFTANHTTNCNRAIVIVTSYYISSLSCVLKRMVVWNWFASLFSTTRGLSKLHITSLVITTVPNWFLSALYSTTINSTIRGTESDKLLRNGIRRKTAAHRFHGSTNYNHTHKNVYSGVSPYFKWRNMA